MTVIGINIVGKPLLKVSFLAVMDLKTSLRSVDDVSSHKSTLSSAVLRPGVCRFPGPLRVDDERVFVNERGCSRAQQGVGCAWCVFNTYLLE